MADVSVKMGISGVSEFKRNLQDSKNAVKTLDAELKKNEAQYKATGDKEKYMAEQSKLLKQKLEEQQRAAKNAEKALETMRKQGVEQTSAEYQKMAQQMLNAQTSMYNTQAALNSLNTTQEKTAKSAGTLSDNVASIGKKMSLQQVQSGLQGVENKLKSAASYALKIGENIVSSVSSGASWADDLLTQSTIFGIDVQTLQKMSVAGEIFDTSVDTIIAAQRKLKRGLGSDSAATKEALNSLKISMYDVWLNDADIPEFEKKAKSAKDLFWEIGEAINKMGPEEESKQEDLANTLFGRNWTDLKPLFDKGKDAFYSFLEEQNALSDEGVQNLADYSDQIAKLKYEWELTQRELESALAPALTKVGEIATNLLSEFNKYLETEEGQQKLGELSDAVASLFEGLEDVDPETMMNGVISVINGLVDSLKWIKDNWSTVEFGIKAIVAAWGISKVANGITKMQNLVNGLRGLFGKGTGNGTGTGTGTPTTSPTGTGGGTGVENVTSQNVTAQNVTTGNTTTEHVTTMYVASMISGGKTPGTPGSPTTGNTPALDSGGGYNIGGGGSGYSLTGGGSGLNGFVPVLYEGGAGGSGLNITGGSGGVNINLSGSPTLNLENGAGGDAITLDPSQYSIDGLPGVNGTNGKGLPGILKVVPYLAGLAVLTEGIWNPNYSGSAEDLEWYRTGAQERYGVEEVSDAVAQAFMSMVEANGSNYSEEIDEKMRELLGIEKFPTDENSLFKSQKDKLTENLKILEENGIEIPADLTLQDKYKEAQRLVDELGVVKVPVQLVNVGPYVVQNGSFPGFANGLSYVPFDGYPAILHKGERVLTARENRNFTYNSNTYFGNVNLNNGMEIDALSESIARQNRRSAAGYGT